MAERQLKLVKRSSGGRPAKVSRERILEVARQLGAGELTFPRIAEKLGVRAPALYYHFKSREDLLHTLAAEFATEFDLKPGSPKRWRGWLEQAVMRFYDFLVANPAVLEVSNWRGLAMFGEPIMEAALETLKGAGYSLKEAGRTWELVSNLAYAQARVLNDISRAGPMLAQAADASQSGPLSKLYVAGSNKNPREHLAETLHWIIAALPRPRS